MEIRKAMDEILHLHIAHKRIMGQDFFGIDKTDQIIFIAIIRNRIARVAMFPKLG